MHIIKKFWSYLLAYKSSAIFICLMRFQTLQFLICAKGVYCLITNREDILSLIFIFCHVYRTQEEKTLCPFGQTHTLIVFWKKSVQIS